MHISMESRGKEREGEQADAYIQRENECMERQRERMGYTTEKVQHIHTEYMSDNRRVSNGGKVE